MWENGWEGDPTICLGEGAAGLSRNVDKVDASGHPLRQTSVEGIDLGMDVGQESETRPTPNFYYQ
jgi:hypothetical protein